jgi:hypothetical protein
MDEQVDAHVEDGGRFGQLLHQHVVALGIDG